MHEVHTAWPVGWSSNFSSTSGKAHGQWVGLSMQERVLGQRYLLGWLAWVGASAGGGEWKDGKVGHNSFINLLIPNRVAPHVLLLLMSVMVVSCAPAPPENMCSKNWPNWA